MDDELGGECHVEDVAAGEPGAQEGTMSRTEAHTPVWARQLNEPHRYREEHDHTKGSCDLDLTRPNEGTCQLSWWRRDSRGETCGCNMCTGHYYHFMERRWWRHQARQYLQDVRKWSTQDRDDIDPFPRHAPVW